MNKPANDQRIFLEDFFRFRAGLSVPDQQGNGLVFFHATQIWPNGSSPLTGIFGKDSPFLLVVLEPLIGIGCGVEL